MLVLLLFFAIICIALGSDSVVSRNVLSSSLKNRGVQGDIDSISPFAKKKVLLTYRGADVQCENIYSHEDRCHFVLKHCEESEVGMFHYLKFYFCTFGHVKPIAFFIMVYFPTTLLTQIIWLSLLFSAIGIASSDFFCPNLATLAQSMRMSESMAGVTFLALGNGSPDLFSTFAAMRVGSGSLAIGELIGAAFFITSVVAGSMAIVNPFKVSRKSFLRDAIFFAGAVGISVALLGKQKITIWETTCMISYYITYVTVVVMATWYWGKRSRRRRQESRARHHYQRPGEEVTEVEEDEATTINESSRLVGDVRDLDISVDEEDEMERGYADLQHRMSLIRPSIETTRTPSHHGHPNIRPSLIGALEVGLLHSLTKDSSGPYPLNLLQHLD